ncbi:MAG: acyl-CoA dehydrogenase family protein [Polyangiaceae bacterium]|nr:acyl-CoA dehydrogenase family protein [Polyangiaceae bacterium]
MDFELSEDQRLLVDSVQSFVKKDSPIERMRRLRDHEVGWEKSTWKQMAELGWLGVLFPESVGGSQLSFVEVGLIIEQLGTTLVPEPITALVTAGVPLWKLGNAEQHERYLSPALGGDTSLALAYLERDGRFDARQIATRAEKTASGYRLSGSKRWVQNGHAADHLVVSARTSGGPGDSDGVSLFLLDAGQPGLRRTTVKQMDGKKSAMLELEGVEVGAERLLGEPGAALPALELALDYGAAATCTEGAGVMQTVLMMTRNYLTERRQFGVPIGSFQALQHRAVDMFVETELAKSTAILAMLDVEAEDAAVRQRSISIAKAQLAESGGFVVRQGTQLHGGIGVTDEHDVGLYFKRMHVLSTLFGDAHFHTRRFASLPSFTRNVA